MKRHPTRLPSARKSSSSALVWWISSTTSASCGRMSPSWNHRRAIPVVTITTFHEGDSGVASRSRLITPTRSSVVPSSVCAMGRIESVLPVPVPATIPKPRRTPLRLPGPDPASSSRNLSASAVSSVPCVRQSVVWRSSPNASSIVSQAARVGAITTRRRVAPEPTNASWSGGRYGSRTRRRFSGESIPLNLRTALGAAIRSWRPGDRRGGVHLTHAAAIVLARLGRVGRDSRRRVGAARRIGQTVRPAVRALVGWRGSCLLRRLRGLFAQVSEDDARVVRPVLDCRRTVRRRGLLAGRHVLEPHAAEPRRRLSRLRHIAGGLHLPCALLLRAQRERGERSQEAGKAEDSNRLTEHHNLQVLQWAPRM